MEQQMAFNLTPKYSFVDLHIWESAELTSLNAVQVSR